jgi:hypothetical protein
MIRFCVQYSRWLPASSETQSSSGSQNGPASTITIRQPCRASRWASTEPPAPAPTITRSTSSESANRRMLASPGSARRCTSSRNRESLSLGPTPPLSSPRQNVPIYPAFPSRLSPPSRTGSRLTAPGRSNGSSTDRSLIPGPPSRMYPRG